MDGVDWGAYSFFHHLRPDWPALTAAARATDTLGSYAVLAGVVLVAAAAFWWTGRRRGAVWLGLLAVGSAVAVELLKLAIHRHRPSDWDGINGSPLSFPSSQAFVSVVVLGAIAVLAGQALSSWKKRVALLGVAILVVVAIGASPLYLGAHFLSDLLAGWAGGLAWLLAGIAFGLPGLTRTREELAWEYAEKPVGH